MIEQVYVTILCTQCITTVTKFHWRHDLAELGTHQISSHNILKHIIFCTFLYLQCHLIAWFNVVWLHYIEQKITLSDLFNSWSLMCIQLVENFEIANWNFLREYILMDPNSISERLTDCYLCMTLYFISNCSILVHGFISDKTKYLNESRWSQSISSLNQTHAKEQWNSLV